MRFGGNDKSRVSCSVANRRKLCCVHRVVHRGYTNNYIFFTIMKKNQEKKKPATWDVEETECFLATIKELQVITLMDGKKFRTSEIFKKVEETFKSKGYNKTHTQLLDKFKALKKRFKASIDALSVSGVGTKDKIKCPFFEELSEIFGHRPIVNQSGVDSIILSPDPNDETSGCASDDEMSVITSNDCHESQAEKFIEHTRNHSSLLPFIPIRHKRSSSSDMLYSPSPISSCLSEDSRTTSTPPLESPDNSEKLCASSSKKRKICKTPTYPRSEGSRSGLKNIMENFTERIIESQEKLLAKTIEEQRKLDKEMFNQYNHIFVQQTQMLLTGLQKLNSPFPTSYPTFQQFSGVSTVPAMRPMFTETQLNQPYPMQSMISRQNETQACPKSDQSEKATSKFTILSPNSIRPEITQSLQNPSTLLHTSTTSRSETLSCSVLEDDKNTEYENVEYLEYA